MKVLYIIHTTQEHGATISFKSMIEGVVEYGVQPIIIYPINQYNDVIRHFESIGCICKPCRIALSIIPNKIEFCSKIKLLLKLLLLKVVSYTDLYRIVRKDKPDIIHTNTGVIREGYWVAKTLHIPHVWHIREYQTKDFNWCIIPSKKRFKKELSKSHCIFITKDLQHYFEQDNKPSSSVVYNPIYDLEEVCALPLEKKNYFLVANRISKEKGIEDIIVGFTEFTKIKDDYSLKIAGDGDEKYINELKNLCKELGVADKVDFLGFISDMRELIRNAEILFVGSYFEAFGRMTAEANILGTYVIGRNTGGTKEIIKLTQGGSLFNGYEEIPAILNHFINSNNNIMEKSQMLALKYFSKTNHYKNIFQVYNNINKR